MAPRANRISFPLLRTSAPADLPVPVAMLLLRLCLIPCLSYLARVVPPGTLAPHAKEFDSTVIRTASEKMGLPPSLDNVALLPLSLPIFLGGFGFRSVRLALPAAYWASFVRSVPCILEFVPESDRLIRGELKLIL